MSGYIATTQVVHIEEGGAIAPGESTPEKFDPESEYNAALIEEGLLRPSDGAESASQTPGDGSGGEPESGAQEPVQSATDKAIELAEAEGVDLADVPGTGDEGKVTVDDVRAYLA